ELPTVIRLPGLVLADRVIEEVGEVGEQVQPVLDAVDVGLHKAAAETLLVVAREAEAVWLAAVRRVDAAVAADLLHRTHRNLVGGVPESDVAHRGEAPLRVPHRSRVAKNTVQAAVVVGVHPGPVVVRKLQAVEELSAAESG